MNVSRILDRLYLGSAPETVANLQTLAGLGISDIIDCRAEKDEADLIGAGPYTFNYHQDGVPDWTLEAAIGKQPLPFEFFQQGDTWVEDHAWPFKTNVTLYVHCSLGMNRSVTLTYFFLRVLGLSATDAIELINKHRIETLPWFDMMDSPWRGDAENALRTLGYSS